MTKHGPDTRADDWPSCVIEAQRPANGVQTAERAEPCGRARPAEEAAADDDFVIAVSRRRAAWLLNA
jgi:hypothetical protein